MIRRWARRTRRRALGPRIAVWYDASYRMPLPTGTLPPGTRPGRSRDALTWALDTAVVAPDEVQSPDRIPWSDAARVHDADYLRSLDDPVVLGDLLGGVEPRRLNADALLDTWRRASGGTLQAARWARRHLGRAVNLLGGFHHASLRRGGGFCGLNDVAIAIATLRREGFDGAVVILDLDAHPPDGIVDLLGSDPQITILSLSVASSWEIGSARSAGIHDHRVPPGTETSAYLDAVRALLSLVPDAPDLAFYLAGGDVLATDPLGDLSVTEAGVRIRDRWAFRALRGVPTVVLPAGGYTDGAWRVLAATVAEATGLRTPVATAYDPVSRWGHRVMATLDPSQLGDFGDWLDDDELLRALGAPTRDRTPRFLGFYTRHGLEYALTEYGLWSALQALGFQGLQVAPLTGERLVVTAPVNGRSERLVDLSATVRQAHGFSVLTVEWLELRDPRTSFTAGRPRLPGQKAPGLGLAAEATQLVTLAAERLNLDGVTFVPAHYHVAWMSRARFEALDPTARGRVRALSRYVEGIPLGEASAILGGPGIPTTDGDPVRWTPVEVVHALSPPLKAWIARGEAEAAEAEAALTARLAPRGKVFGPR